MVNLLVERRVTNLEEAMAELAHAQAMTQIELGRLSREMREFKDEMGDFKDEMHAFKDEMSDFKNEMSDFKNEMSAYKNRAEQRDIEMNKRWGELANKMGTMVEDLIAPSIPRIVREITGCAEEDIELSAIRVKRKLADKGNREFDAIAVCGEFVLINETKSSLEPRDIKRFAKAMTTARDFLPEYSDRKFIGAIASLYVDESLVRQGERRGLIVLGFGTNVMQVLNTSGFTPKLF